VIKSALVTATLSTSLFGAINWAVGNEKLISQMLVFFVLMLAIETLLSSRR
jgi:hypothetical protein